jgi:hypothetical protein
MSRESVQTTQWWEEYRTAARTSEVRRAEVYVRSHAPTPGGHDYRRRVFERLDDAISDQALDRYDVTIVGDSLCLCEFCVERPPGRQLVETFSAVWDWGDGTVEPVGFEEKVIDSTVTGERHRVLVPPEMCLSLTVDDDIVGVFPSSIDGTAFNTIDVLEAITTGTVKATPNQADA